VVSIIGKERNEEYLKHKKHDQSGIPDSRAGLKILYNLILIYSYKTFEIQKILFCHLLNCLDLDQCEKDF
jgi:hypothetical protein